MKIFQSQFDVFVDAEHREIAERLGLSVRTVDKHIELALKDLHSSLC